jgi:hypothetical protein
MVLSNETLGYSMTLFQVCRKYCVKMKGWVKMITNYQQVESSEEAVVACLIAFFPQ